MRSDAELIQEIESDDATPLLSVSDPALVQLSMACLELSRAEDAVRAAVLAARDAGCSWQQVGDVLGMTRQGALKRYRVA